MQTNNTSLTVADLNKQVHKALSLWHKSPARGSPLEQLLIVQQTLSEAGGNLRLATNQVLHHALTTMATQHADLSDLLRMRFLDRKTVHALTIERNVAEATIYIQQNRAITLLTSVVIDMEQAAGRAFRHSLADRLPPPSYVSLVGVSDHLSHLLQLITSFEGPDLLLVEGIGGIGKSSLADALVRQAIRYPFFEDVCWVNAQQQYFHLDGRVRQIPRPALTANSLIDELADQLLPDSPERYDRGRAVAMLRERLAHTPHLVAVDNLEAVASPDKIFALIRQLAGMSRFLLLSRHCYYGESEVYHFRLGELDEYDALTLVRHEAAQRNLPDLAQASDGDLRPIIDTVGGNPLALRLIVGQVHIRPLPNVLADLSAACGEPAEALYAYIYRQAWDELDELCRRVLLVMPLVAESGGSEQHLSQISALPVAEICRALAVLVNRNLVDSRGDLMQRRYAIHNLTRSFLLEQVVRWQH